jgi:hypothetical protein
MTKRPAATRHGQGQTVKEHTVSISSDTSCVSFIPGHNTPASRSGGPAGFDDWVDVQAYADIDLDLLQLVVDGRQQLMWFHDLAALALALAGSGGAAQWCARYSTLLVPGGFNSPARRSFFSLAAPEGVRPCQRVRAASGVEAAPAPVG